MPSPERPKKKVRLPHDACGSIATRRADESTSLEVDHMILDYLVWKAIDACLHTRRQDDQSNLNQTMSMVEDFYSLFQSRHPDFDLDHEIRFRMLLLQLTTLFTQRLHRSPYTPDSSKLDALRFNNKARAMSWIGSAERQPTATHDTAPFDDCLPLPPAALQGNRAHVLSTLEASAKPEANDETFYGTRNCVSLLDLLPLFFQVSAARHSFHNDEMSDQLIDLTVMLMLQACLEQYLVFGADGSDAIDEAFAWGYQPMDAKLSTLEASDPCAAQENAMFEGETEDSTEFPGWTRARNAALAILFGHGLGEEAHNPGDMGLVARLEHIASLHPFSDVDRQVREYIGHMAKSINEPVLAQLEKGQLKGMSQAETQQFLRDCGLDETKLFPRW